MLKARVPFAAAFIGFPILLSSCGAVEVDNGCVLIKKQSLEKRDIGSALLEKVNAGQAGEGQVLEQVQSEGLKYIIEGTKLVVENPQCFSKEDVKTAKNLLGR